MLREAFDGAVAGLVGTAVLDATTYTDVAVRGRPPSGTPTTAVRRAADAAGIDLGGGDTGEHRAEGLGSLAGYLVGLGLGVGYGLVAPRTRRLPLPVSGAAVGLAAMAATDVPLTISGVTDPTSWSRSAWLSDLVPHLLYGVAVVATWRALESR